MTHPVLASANETDALAPIGRAALVKASDEQAERATLSAVIHADALEQVLAIVRPRAFYAPANAALLAAAMALHEGGQAIDEQTIASYLTRAGKFDAFGGWTWLQSFRDGTPAAEHAQAHARVVAELYAQRKIVETCMSVVADGLAGKTDPLAFVDRAVRRVSTAVERPQASPLVQMVDVVSRRHDAWKQMRERGYEGGIATGIRNFDRRTDGLARSGVTFLAADTGVGKSIAGWGIATHVAGVRRDANGGLIPPAEVRDRKAVVYVSGEMDEDELHDRAVCSVARVTLRELRRVMMGARRYDDEDEIDTDRRAVIEAEVQTAQHWLSQAPLFIYPRVADIHDVRGALRDTRRQLAENAADPKNPMAIGLLAVDYLQMMRMQRAERFDVALGDFARDLKVISTEDKIATLALAQANANSEKRDGKRYSNMDLKHSTSMSDHAHTIVFLSRPVLGMAKKPRDEREKWKNYATFDVTKGRSHAQGSIPVFFDGAHYTIRDAHFGEFDGLHGDGAEAPQSRGRR